MKITNLENLQNFDNFNLLQSNQILQILQKSDALVCHVHVVNCINAVLLHSTFWLNWIRCNIMFLT